MGIALDRFRLVLGPLAWCACLLCHCYGAHPVDPSDGGQGEPDGIARDGGSTSRDEAVEGGPDSPPASCLDDDGDGYGEGPGCLGPDCDDGCATCHPGGVQTCDHGRDHDCNGVMDELEACGDEVFATVALGHVMAIAIDSEARRVVARGSYAFVAAYFAGLVVVDMTEPSVPVATGAIDLDGKAIDLFLSGPTVFVASDYGGLHVVDVSDPSQPRASGHLRWADGNVYDVFATREQLFVALFEQGLAVSSLATAQDPAQDFSLIPTIGHARGLFVDLPYCYVAADYDGGLEVLDVGSSGASLPAGPAAGLQTEGEARSVFVSGQVAYVADYEAGVRLVDVSSPTEPRAMGSIPVPDKAYETFVRGNLAFVAAGTSGLVVADVSDPETPEIIESLFTEGNVSGVFVLGQLVFLADTQRGLIIVEAELE